MCSLKVMLDTLIEMEIDVKKMPLGKIKREQLLKGMKALRYTRASACLFLCINRCRLTLTHA